MPNKQTSQEKELLAQKTQVFKPIGSQNGNAKLTESDVLSISQLIKSGVTKKE